MRAKERQDRGAIFDAALTRGLELPEGLSPAAARQFHVEHHPREWTEQDYREWIAHFGDQWAERQVDPRWKAMRSELAIGLGGQPFAKLEKMPLTCHRRVLREKIIEALADALDALKTDQTLRSDLAASRDFAECDLQDARSRCGRHPEPWKRIIKDREAKAREAIADVRRMQAGRGTVKAAQKDIMDDLTLNLFAIVRHVTPRRTVVIADWVSDKRIHAEAVQPIIGAFTKASGVVSRRTARDGSIQADPRIRLHRWRDAERRQSERAADIWRDGRRPETFDDVLERATARLFGWDERFAPAVHKQD